MIHELIDLPDTVDNECDCEDGEIHDSGNTELPCIIKKHEEKMKSYTEHLKQDGCIDNCSHKLNEEGKMKKDSFQKDEKMRGRANSSEVKKVSNEYNESNLNDLDRETSSKLIHAHFENLHELQ